MKLNDVPAHTFTNTIIIYFPNFCQREFPRIRIFFLIFYAFYAFSHSSPRSPSFSSDLVISLFSSVERFAKWQATKCPFSTSTIGTFPLLHFSVAIKQRVWNLQPFGGVTGLGGFPCKIIRSSLRSFIDGNALISAMV